MPAVMLVKCEKCGYENFPQHRYCGMCAAPLRIPGVAAAPASTPPAQTPLPPVQQGAAKYEEPPLTSAKEAAPRQLSGPSFLGLGQEPAEDKSFSYLFEEDTPRHRGRNVVVFLLFVAIAAAIWHWRQDLRIVADRLLNTLPATPKPAAPEKTEANAPASNPAESTAAPTTSGSSTSPSGLAPAAPAQAQTPPPASDAAAAPPAAGSEKTDSTAGKPEAPAPGESSAQNATHPATPGHEESTETQDSAKAPNPPPPARRPAVTRAERVTAAVSRSNDLEAQGEKYLYGNGVPENCTRARTNLMAAAEQSNAQAESVLGTMYATGHCATRDLPTAYRWFGRSLRQDQKNTRIEQDLQVLWNQMTPGERQLAIRSGR